MASPFNLLITGGSRGIGRATSILAAKQNWNIGVNYVRDGNAARSTVNEVKLHGGSGILLHGNVEHESDVISMFDAMEKTYGPVNGLVVNAGITAPAMALADMGLERLRRMLDVNVLGAILCAREGARRMSERRGGKGGSIVFVSSAASRLGKR